MKLSVADFNSDDEERVHACSVVKIFLNDVEQSLVIEADEENGYIIKYQRTVMGDCVFDEFYDPMTEIVYGKVKIVYEGCTLP